MTIRKFWSCWDVSLSVCEIIVWSAVKKEPCVDIVLLCQWKFAAFYLQASYSNLTACQTLGNMCVAIMYTRDNQGDQEVNDACAAFSSIASSGGTTTDEW